ncbi:MAG TPA: UbiA family prenyltransferase [Methylomirabilota bacterium]|jgi:4-hydroxybenzoate polyprenyltransferase|nr:UbiA family prenyltransferase [Methylomirabilota bacterium]
MTTPRARADSAETDTPARSRIVALASCIRYGDVLVLQGSPLMGVAFSIGTLTVPKLEALAVFALASFLLVAHIWTFNDWSGLASDRNDPNKSAEVFERRGVASRDILLFSVALLAGSLLLFSLLSSRSLLLAAAIAAMGVFYSHPGINAKGIPVLSSSPHLIGGLLHFLLGYSLFGGIDRRGVLIGLFFALTFTAGHLNQEVRDYEGDRLNRLTTNAVAFGRTAAFLAGLLIFTLAYADLFFLAYTGIVPIALVALPVVLYPIHVFWCLTTLRGGLTYERVSRFQGRYRLLYAVIGLSMVATLLM